MDNTPSSDNSFFKDAAGVDASGQFYDIGRDCITTTINNYIDLTQNPEQTRVADQTSDQHLPLRSLIISSVERQSVLEILSYGGPDISLLFSQVASLLDHHKALRAYGALKPELELLEQTLVATGFGIKAFRATRIGHYLAETIKPILGQCVNVLQDLFDAVNTYRQNLWPTSIHHLWRQVWHWGCEVSELELWRNKLFGCRSRLAMVVMALNSIEWTSLGNELLTGPISAHDLNLSLMTCPPSLHGIQISKIRVTDHLGDDILVPSMFCSAEESFDVVFKGFCKNRPGNHYVERGEYQVISAEDGKVMTPLDFNAVQSGMRLEISIILRQRTSSRVNRKICPRCRHVNSTVTPSAGWINCRRCPMHFQVEEVQADDEDEDNIKNGDGDMINRTGISNETRDGADNSGIDSMEREEQQSGQGYNEEITSSTSRTQGSNVVSIPMKRKIPPHADDETKKFLRVSLFCKIRSPTERLHVNTMVEQLILRENALRQREETMKQWEEEVNQRAKIPPPSSPAANPNAGQPPQSQPSSSHASSSPAPLVPFPGDLDPHSVPAELMKEGSDWFALFNPKVKRELDVSLIHTLVHESVVCCVRFSADGKFLATGCDRTAQIYDTKTGGKTCVLADESVGKAGDLYCYIRSVCFSPDGKYLATGAEDNQIRIWNIAKKRIRNVFDGHQQEIYSLDFSPDGRLVVSGSADKTVRIWSMDLGTSTVLTIDDPDSVNNDAGVTSVAISPNGKLVAAGSLDTIVRIWDMETAQLVARLRGHRDSVYSIVFTPDGQGLVSGSLDKTLKHWDVSGLSAGAGSGVKSPTEGQAWVLGLGSLGGELCTMNFTGHKDYVLEVAVSPDGQWFASGSKDRGVQFWDARTGVVQCMLQGHKNSVISVDLSPAGNVLATGSGDWEARIWSYNTI